MSEGKKGVKSARFDLMPEDALWLVALVFGAGATKYAERNWERGYDWSKSYGAMRRHQALFWHGEDIDPEFGLPHLAHAAWHSLVLLAFYLRGAGNDDRPFHRMPEEEVRQMLEAMRAELTNPEEIEEAKREVEEGPGSPSDQAWPTRDVGRGEREFVMDVMHNGEPVQVWLS